MSAESEYVKKVCGLCAEVCEACAAECEKHAGHMEHCKLCADANAQKNVVEWWRCKQDFFIISLFSHGDYIIQLVI